MADVLPELADLIEGTPDGFRVTTHARSLGAIGGMTTFGLVVGGSMAFVSFFLMFLSPGCCIFVFAGLLVMVVSPFAGAAMRQQVTVDITDQGIRENTALGQQVTWKNIDSLVLKGDLRKRSARLKAGSIELYTWKALKVEAESGWTVERVRWFANAIGGLSGIELQDELPSEAAFREREEQKQAKLAELRADKVARLQERNQAAFPEQHAIAAEPAQTVDLEGHTAFVLDVGEEHRPGRQTSTTEEQPVCLDGDMLVVGKRRQALADFTTFHLVFEREGDEVYALLLGQLKNGQTWKVARRAQAGTAKLAGVAAALNDKL